MSTLSLGVVGFMLWGILRPERLVTIHYRPRLTPAVLLLGFSVYALLVSLASVNLIAIVYAFQYAFYLGSGYLLLGGYLASGPAARTRALNTIGLVGGIFAVGGLVSLWTGPIYGTGAGFSVRQWGGTLIQQGVGFASNPNEAAAILIILNAVVWFGFPRGWFSLKVILLLALLATISRSGVIAYLVALFGFWSLVTIRSLLLLRISRAALRSLAITIAVSVLLFAVIGLSRKSSDFWVALTEGFGFGTMTVLSEDVELRLSLWKKGVDIWLAGGWPEQTFGRGFRTSSAVEDDVWWTPHNFYLAVLGDFGIVGLLIFVAPFLWFLFVCTSRLIQTGGSGIEKAAWVAVVALLIHNLTETFFYSTTIITLVLFMLLAFSTEPRPLLGSLFPAEVNLPRFRGHLPKVDNTEIGRPDGRKET